LPGIKRGGITVGKKGGGWRTAKGGVPSQCVVGKKQSWKRASFKWHKWGGKKETFTKRKKKNL